LHIPHESQPGFPRSGDNQSTAVTPPDPIPLSAGLELHLLQTAHAGAIFAAVHANRDHLRVWLPWVDRTITAEHTLAFLRDHVERREEGLGVGYGLWRQETLLGLAGIHDISVVDRQAKIGYWLSKDCEGQGHMTRAVRALLTVCYGSLGLERVEILCAVGNERSRAIPERLGFTFEGVLRHAQFLNGRFVDLRLYSLLRQEYRP
jgi:ribosomal-protein-serine acetyltransferase